MQSPKRNLTYQTHESEAAPEITIPWSTASKLPSLKAHGDLIKWKAMLAVTFTSFSGYLIGLDDLSQLNSNELAATLISIYILSAGGTALNQFQDRSHDARMPRTLSRPIPQGLLSATYSLYLAVALLTIGMLSLILVSNTKTALLGLSTFALYNGAYTLWWKRRWVYGTIPGSISGALPLWMGFTAATDQWFSLPMLYLLMLLFIWQMPHSWTLALHYKEDYRQGGFPILPVSRSEKQTRLHIIIWSLLYLGLALSAPLYIPECFPALLLTVPLTIKVGFELKRFNQPDVSGDSWKRYFKWLNISLLVYLFSYSAHHLL